MRAIGVTEFGPPEVLHVVELPEPEAGPGEVRVRVHAAAVSPTDTVLRSGLRATQLRDVPPPYVPGMDVAGVLDQIGPGTETDLAVGEPVMGIVVPKGAHGAYAEYVVLPASSVVRQPAGASDAEASTLPMNGLTSALALRELGLSSGQTIGVTGAAGAVGGYAIELAVAAGLRVIADAAEPDSELVARLGADVVVERGPAFADRLREIEPEGAHGVVDGALLDEAVLPAVRDGGRVATVRGFRGPEVRGVTWHPVWVTRHATDRAALDELRRQVEAGQVTLRVADVLPAARAAEAHRRLEAGGVRGRLVLQL